jgi:aminocarboxymuconate-semialdehyde decarboxylase
MLKIDAHTHIMPRDLPNWSKKLGYGAFIHLDHHREGAARMMQGDRFFREVMSNCWHPQERIEEYGARGVQVQVVCTIPVLFAYWAKAADTHDISKYLNDDIARTVQDNPRHYVGLGTLPMQDTERSVQELERCAEIGLKGVQIGSNINGYNLSEKRFDPIWAACERLGMAVMVHPWDMMGKEMMEKYWLPWLVGMPAETSRAACSMIFGGVFERFPKLRVMMSHASGAFLATLGRIEHGFNCRPDLVAVDNPNNPRNYVGHFWVDSITHDARLMEYVLDMQGADRVMMGSDYPFPLGDLEFGKFMEDEMDLSPEDLGQIFNGSALSWLDLRADQFE